MYYNKVELCGINTAQLKILTDEEKRELLESLELYFKVFFLNEDAAELLKEGDK